MANICPVCKRDDAIQKASAIVSGGTASGTYYDSEYSRRNVHTTTDLARMLTPPEEPKISFGHGWTKYGCMIPFVGFALFYGAFSLLAIFMVPELTENPIQSILVSFEVVGLPIFLCLGLGLFTFFLKGAIDRNNSRRYDIEHPRWKNAKERWDRLYFCHRDGIVFDPKPSPGAQETCLPQDLRTFIFS